MVPKDNFSQQASIYAQYRPSYPSTLYETILKEVKGFSKAWDCATGNGQAAKVLAQHFEKVYATDISQKQLDHAPEDKRIEYLISPAEQTPFEDDQFDLVTVAQAVHWFDHERFNQEVQRVAKPGAVVAVWGYELLRISPEIDAVVDQFYTNVVGEYWDPERVYIDEHYHTIPFPFADRVYKTFEYQAEWTVDILEGYLNTWSAVQKFIRENGYNPVDHTITLAKTIWKPGERKGIRIPIFMKMGQVK
ncbi:MAG: class I SAM-dependent methyltransferase [Bacteroidota bacterium]